MRPYCLNFKTSTMFEQHFIMLSNRKLAWVYDCVDGTSWYMREAIGLWHFKLFTHQVWCSLVSSLGRHVNEPSGLFVYFIVKRSSTNYTFSTRWRWVLRVYILAYSDRDLFLRGFAWGIIFLHGGEGWDLPCILQFSNKYSAISHYLPTPLF